MTDKRIFTERDLTCCYCGRSWREVTRDKNGEVLMRAIAAYGGPAQVLKAIEELLELSIELNHHIHTLNWSDAHRLHYIDEHLQDALLDVKAIRWNELSYRKAIEDNDRITDECADVTIMLKQLKSNAMFNNKKEVDKRIDFKIKRLEERLNNG